LASRVQPIVDVFEVEVGVLIKHLETGETYIYRADEPFPTASLIKLPIMIAAYDAVGGRFPLEL
jgi:beta-lactamase class A